MNQEEVQSILLQMSGMCEEEIEAYSTILTLACAQAAARLKDGQNAADPRVSAYAAAVAYYMICLCESAKDGIASFTAGDISIAGNTDRAAAAKQLLNAAEKNCAGMLRTDTFAFMGV